MSTSPDSKPSVPPRRRGKWLIRIAIVLALLLILPVVLAPLLVNPVVRPKVVEALRAELTGEPQIDSISFSWFSGITIEGLRIGNPPGFSPGVCISVDRVTMNPELLALFQGGLLLKQDFRIEKPRINVEQNAQGAVNVASLLRATPAKATPTAPKTQQPAPAAPAAMPTVRGGFVVEDLALTLKTPTLPQPVALSPIRAETRIESLDKPITLAIKNSDGSLDAKGNMQVGQAGKLDPANIKGEFDYDISPAFLAPLKPALSSFGPVKKFEGTLAGRGRISLAGLSRPSGKGDLTLDIAEVAAELAGADGKSVLRTMQPGVTKLDYEFLPGADGKSDLKLQLASPVASLTFAGLVTQTADGPAVEGELSAASDIAVFAERFPGLVPTDRKLQGRFSGGVKNLKAGLTTFSGELNLRGEGLKEVGAGETTLSKGLAALGEPLLDLQFKVDAGSGSYQIGRASLKTALANVDGQADVSLDKEGKLTKLDGRVNGAAELQKLRDLIVPMGLLTNATELAGNLKLSGNIAAGQGGFPYAIQASVAGLHFKGPQTGGVAIDEPESALNLKGLFTSTKDGTTISIAEGSEMRLQTATAKLSGTVRQQPNQPLCAENLVAELTYNPPRLKPFLKAFNAGEILATQPQSARLVLSGPIQPGTDIPAWLAQLTLTAKMGYQAYSHTGVKVEGDPLAAEMRAGKLPLDYTFKLNGGSASVKGELNAQGPESRALLKADQLALNVEMAPMLGFLSPLLFAKNGQLEGQASASFDGVWTGPLNMSALPQGPAPVTITDLLSQRVSGRGQLAVKNLRVSGAPLLTIVLSYLGAGTGGQLGEIEPTEFVVEKGRLTYQKMVVKLGGFTIILSGRINFDQTMEMQISLPFPQSLREKNKEIAKYLGESLTVPLTGTLSSPKLDTSKALQLALKDAGTKALKEKGGSLLKGLFDKSDKK